MLFKHSRKRVHGVALVMLAGCFWSLGGILMRSIEAANAWQILCLRSVSVTLFFFTVLYLRQRGQVLQAFASAGWPGLLGGFSLACGFSGFVFAIANTTVANAVFILSAAPFPTALLAWVLLRERVTPAIWIAMFGAVCGVCIMVFDGVQSGTWFGSMMALVAMLGFSGFAVALRVGRDNNMLPTICFAGIFSALFAFFMYPDMVVSSRDLLLCMAMGIVQIGIGMLCFTFGSRFVPAVELALLSLTEVVLSPIWVWLLIDEVPGPLTLLGGSIVLFAIIASALAGVHRVRN